MKTIKTGENVTDFCRRVKGYAKAFGSFSHFEMMAYHMFSDYSDYMAANEFTRLLSVASVEADLD